MKQDNDNSNHIIADEGKIFRRKSSGEIFGKEIHLGYSYYINGVLLDEPHKDEPEDFEEIDDPDYKEEETTETTEGTEEEITEESEVSKGHTEEPTDVIPED